MDLKEIKQIVDLMRRSDLTEFEIEEKELKLRIRRAPGGHLAVDGPAPAERPLPPPVARELPSLAATPPPAPGDTDKEFLFVKSPMVGTFYRSPSPDSPSFVNEGSVVKEDSVVCIIEAMKVMNEIQAEHRGTVVAVLVDNGKPVEYGQPLFKLKPAS